MNQPNSSHPSTESNRPYFQPHPLDDRAYWTGAADDPLLRRLLEAVEQTAAAAPERPALPAATDYLAAKRSNDRARLDRFWRNEWKTFAALVLRRCLRGVEPSDPDDRLLNWLFALTTHPSWVVSAHLPDNDLPAAGSPQLDLAACEMAGSMAEAREVLKPWIDSHSGTLADTIVTEIDRRVLEPFVKDPPWWGIPGSPRINNWTGVCAGGILVACESLARQGHPRPAARALALQLLEVFFREAFTEHGECDEGMGYWNYGVGYACNGLMRLSPSELRRRIDLDRLRQVASYPGRAHLFGDVFYSGNDASLRAPAPLPFIPWLATVTGDPFLPRWARIVPLPDDRCVMSALRLIESLRGLPEAQEASLPPRIRQIQDQQVVVLRTPADGRELLVALGGGHNAERHNHNDLGHFIVAVDGEVIVPDLGAPFYTADFFRSVRYSYLSASSRGHCCPLVNGVEQRPGREARGRVESEVLQDDQVEYRLDLTEAYPPEAGLRKWTRSLRQSAAQQKAGEVLIVDEYALNERGRVTHVLWSVVEPKVRTTPESATLDAGPLRWTLSPPPAELRIEPVDPAAHRLKDFAAGTPLYRIAADYDCDGPPLNIQTRLTSNR